MKEIEIINAIMSMVSYHHAWTIGITDDPECRKKEHGNPKVWHHWRADTKTIAKRVENYFLDKGMKDADGGGESPNYVYIFI